MSAEASAITTYPPDGAIGEQHIPPAGAPDEFQPAPEQASWWSRAKVAVGHVALAGAVALGIATEAAVNPTPAAAASRDYGDYLTGQYPQHTRCGQDAEDVYSEPLRLNSYDLNLGWNPIQNVGEVDAGLYTIRRSPSCGTVWTVVETNQITGVKFVGIHQDTGHRQQKGMNPGKTTAGPGRFISPMIYDHGNRYRSYVRGVEGYAQVYDKGTNWIKAF